MSSFPRNYYIQSIYLSKHSHFYYILLKVFMCYWVWLGRSSFVSETLIFPYKLVAISYPFLFFQTPTFVFPSLISFSLGNFCSIKIVLCVFISFFCLSILYPNMAYYPIFVSSQTYFVSHNFLEFHFAAKGSIDLIFFVFLFHFGVMPGVTPGSAPRNHVSQYTENHMKFRRSHPSPLHEKQAPYLLYYLCYPRKMSSFKNSLN